MKWKLNNCPYVISKIKEKINAKLKFNIYNYPKLSQTVLYTLDWLHDFASVTVLHGHELSGKSEWIA